MSPLKNLNCTCCGKRYRGVYYGTQDTGYGLGPCCVDHCQFIIEKSNPLEWLNEFIETYGADCKTLLLQRMVDE